MHLRVKEFCNFVLIVKVNLNMTLNSDSHLSVFDREYRIFHPLDVEKDDVLKMMSPAFALESRINAL